MICSVAIIIEWSTKGNNHLVIGGDFNSGVCCLDKVSEEKISDILNIAAKISLQNLIQYYFVLFYIRTQIGMYFDF